MLTQALKVGLLLTIALAVGCGDSNGTPNTDAGQTGTIVDVAVGNDDFSILVAALTRAELVTTLQSAGPFTVFAPTNAAFAASDITLDDVETMDVDALTQILLYHVISGASVGSGAVTAGPVDSAAEDTTGTWNLSLILGTTGGVTLNGGNAQTGGANVVTADVAASNGVIHIIDRVLLPPTITDMTAYAGLTDLRQAVVDADLATTLSGAGPFTVFAPTNAAFPDGGARPTGDALSNILLYHVVAAGVPSGSVPARANAVAENEAGNNMTLLFDTTSGVAVNGIDVILADVGCTNGVVHVIDGVLLPPTVIDMAGIAGLTSLAAAIGRADMSGAGIGTLLSGDAPGAATGFTVFAPTNAAFTAIQATVDGLTNAQVAQVLQYHVLDPATFTAPVLSTGLATGNVATALGQNAAVDISVSPPTIDGAAVVPTLLDIHVSNGVVHVLSGVMVPTL
ncbi:MAG: fasciclin domain-containing protein [Sandaracinaceae bacterium]|nr:fasciclin domain-containing protein [Sandaracinaceae bacterium]MBK7156417.1 fasciclin domain-containing protein [Sandaracinaceae bacterium]MBK8408390.1 fasciclin domain-containing protein [Sandaracinaceae bacterium]MBK8593063.1 fasciclin domain-containing protein [Sandaracinaceae bacterium]